MTASRSPAGRATSDPELPKEGSARRAALVERFGAHPAADLGIALDDPDDGSLGQWLIETVQLDPRTQLERARDPYQAIESAGIATPDAISSAGPAALSRLLAGAGYPKPEAAAQVLVRAAQSLGERWGGSLSRLAGDSLDLEELAGNLARLAPGFGRASVARFLRPLRETWIAASELPLDPAAASAAVHLDLLESTGTLRRARAGTEGREVRDLEWALERIGRRSCLRERAARCPLPSACPLRRPN